MRLGDSPQSWRAAGRALAALERFEPGVQLQAAGWVPVAVLGVLRSRFAETPQDRQAFDRLCGEMPGWLRREIEALRFAKAQ
jgi:hypothetical protein